MVTGLDHAAEPLQPFPHAYPCKRRSSPGFRRTRYPLSRTCILRGVGAGLGGFLEARTGATLELAPPLPSRDWDSKDGQTVTFGFTERPPAAAATLPAAWRPLNAPRPCWDTTQGRTVAPCRASGGARPGLAVYSGAAAFRSDVEPRHRKTRPTESR